MTYNVRLKPSFPAPYRNRAGLSIPAGPQGVTVELSDEQLVALEADAEIIVTALSEPQDDADDDNSADDTSDEDKAAEEAAKADAEKKEAAKKKAANKKLVDKQKSKEA